MDAILSVRIIYDKRTNRSKGYAYIDFRNQEECQLGLKEASGQRVDGRVIYAALSDPPKRGDRDDRTLFLNNIPHDSTREDIQTAMSEFVRRCFVPWVTLLGEGYQVNPCA